MICERCGSEMVEVPNHYKELLQTMNENTLVIKYDVVDMKDIIGYKCKECGWRYDK